MRYSIYPYKLNCRKILLLLFFFSLWQATLAQSISGPTCVVAGTQYQYNFSGTFTQSTFFNGVFQGVVLWDQAVAHQNPMYRLFGLQAPVAASVFLQPILPQMPV